MPKVCSGLLRGARCNVRDVLRAPASVLPDRRAVVSHVERQQASGGEVEPTPRSTAKPRNLHGFSITNLDLMIFGLNSMVF